MIPSAPSQAVAAASAACRLEALRVVVARGADAASFLQGQLTQDVLTLRPDEARLGGFCSAKGRLQASLLLWSPGPEDVRMLVRADLAEAFCRRLSLFVLRARCKLSLEPEWQVWGLKGCAPGASPAAGPSLPPPWRRESLPSMDAAGGAELIGWPACGPHATPRALWISPTHEPRPGAPAAPMSETGWQREDIACGIPWIETPTIDRFVPQMVNLELLGGVNFRKGCYPGQEVVARSQYRGTLKRRMGLFGIADATARAGQEVYAPDDAEQPVGLVVNAAEDGVAALALVELKTTAWGRQDLRLATADGPLLTPRPLPYPVPLEAQDP